MFGVARVAMRAVPRSVAQVMRPAMTARSAVGGAVSARSFFWQDLTEGRKDKYSESKPDWSNPKQSTNIAGLDVIPNAREVFIGLQKEILASIADYNKQLGFEPEFNRQSRVTAEFQLRVAMEEKMVENIENRLHGILEEVIQQTEDELDLIVYMNGPCARIVPARTSCSMSRAM